MIVLVHPSQITLYGVRSHSKKLMHFQSRHKKAIQIAEMQAKTQTIMQGATKAAKPAAQAMAAKMGQAPYEETWQ